MKRSIFIIILTLFLLIPVDTFAKENNQVRLYLFHGEGCQHCTDEKEFIEKLEKKYNNLKVFSYEVWGNTEFNAKMKEIKSLFSVSSPGVPFTVIGDKYFLGFNESIGRQIEQAIIRFSNTAYIDDTGVTLGIITDREQGQDLITSNELKQELDNNKTANNYKIINNIVIVPGLSILIIGTVTIALTGLIIYLIKRKRI